MQFLDAAATAGDKAAQLAIERIRALPHADEPSDTKQ